MNFPFYEFEGDFQKAFGQPEKNFRMLIFGPEKHGKTDLALKYAKYLCRFGKVLFNSSEEGKSKTMQDAFHRNEMREVAGKFFLCHKETHEDIKERLAKKYSGYRFYFNDSIDYNETTERQYKELVKLFPRLAQVHLSWEDTKGNPLTEAAKMIAKRVDIKVYVKNRIAYPTSRFGGNELLTFGPPIKTVQQPGTQLTLQID